MEEEEEEEEEETRKWAVERKFGSTDGKKAGEMEEAPVRVTTNKRASTSHLLLLPCGRRAVVEWSLSGRQWVVNGSSGSCRGVVAGSGSRFFFQYSNGLAINIDRGPDIKSLYKQ